MSWIRCAALALSFSACSTVVDMSGVEVGAEISRLWREHIAAAKRKDAAAVGAIYADDIVYRVPGQEVRGRAAIDAMEAKALAEAEVVHAEHELDSLRVFGDVAYELGTIAGPVRVGEQPARTVTFHFMAMWRRGADGVWRIESFAGAPE